MAILPKYSVLETCPLFAHFSENQLENMLLEAQKGSSNRYQFIFMPDEKATCFYVLLSGNVRLGYFAPDGQAVIKEMLKPGAIFGEQVLLGQDFRPDFAVAEQDEVQWLSIQAVDYQQLMQHSYLITQSLLEHLNTRLNQVENRLGSLISKDARTRIIGFLHETAHRDGRKVGYETVLKHGLTQQDMANLTGTSRQTVTSVLNELRKSNLIHFNRHSILIRDLEKLA
jgi:CRP/FNR family transcriptional regulator, cyclic AMP receptor protein